MTIREGNDTNAPEPASRYWCGRCGHPIPPHNGPGWSHCRCRTSGVYLGEDWRDPAANHSFVGDVKTITDLE